MAEWDDDAAQTPQAVGEKAGLSADQINDWIAKYGPEVVKDAAALIQSGFSVQWVADTLNNLGFVGPTALALLLNFKKESARAGASPFSPILVNILVDQLSAMLPRFFSGFQLVAAQAALEALAKMLAAAG